ncbi:MAG: hypothetical protein SWH78_01910 [Thermodesulfobacteriota bacterium]|nr:hypothetical protein [Thermodesulfobacteriota bacterium]
MIRIIAGLVFPMLLISMTSYGAEKLLITDVLSKREAEAEASFTYARGYLHFYSPPPISATAKSTLNLSFLECSLGLGLGHGFQVEASIPYAFSVKTRARYYVLPAGSTDHRRDGFGDISFGTKCELFSEKEKPFTLVAGLGLKLDTASEDQFGTGATDISPFVAASTTIGQGVRPYATYELTIRNHGERDTHVLGIGAEKELNDRLTLVPFLEVSFHKSTDTLSSYETYVMGVRSHIRIYGNFYAIPLIGFEIDSPVRRKDMDLRFDSSEGIQIGLAFYHLF